MAQNDEYERLKEKMENIGSCLDNPEDALDKWEIIIDILNNLETLVEKGLIDLVDVKLKLFFEAFEKFLPHKELIQSLPYFSTSLELLQKRFERVRQYIRQYHRKENIDLLLSSNLTDDAYSDFLSIFLYNPLEVPLVSLTYLSKSLKNRFKKRNRNAFLLDEQETSMPLMERYQDFPFVEDNFNTSLESFYDSIQACLPASLEQILSSSKDKDEYLKHFSYVLYLLYNGKLYYDKERKVFLKRTEKGVDL